MQEKQPSSAGSRPRRWRPLAGVVLCLAAVVLGDPVTLAGEYARQVLRPNAQGLTLSRGLRTVRLPSGLVGVSFAYQGTFRGQGRDMPLQGEVTVVVGQRDGVVFDAWAQPEVYEYERADAQTMIL